MVSRDAASHPVSSTYILDIVSTIYLVLVNQLTLPGVLEAHWPRWMLGV